MSLFSASLAALFTALLLVEDFGNVQAGVPSIGDKCRRSSHFAQIFRKLCEPHLTAQDCQVGAWGQWAASKTSQGCSLSRSRKVTSWARNGGNPCPSLKGTKTINCPSSKNEAQQLLSVLKSGLGGFAPYSPIRSSVRLTGGPGLRGSPGDRGGPLLNQTHTRRYGVAKRSVNCTTDRDIVIIVDTSGSVGKSDFQSALSDLSDLIPMLCGFQPEMIKYCNSYRLAMLTYGNSPKLAFDLDDYLYRHKRRVNIKNDIKTKPVYTGGGTGTGAALKFARDQVLQESFGMRPYSKKAILLLTDGHSNGATNPVTVAAEMFEHFKDKGELSIVALGIGDNIDYQELIDITNHHNVANPLVYFTQTFQSFHEAVSTLKTLTEQVDTCSADVLDKKR
ncbi:collagen alpha-1(VI) chain-like [Corticium candelabrum]|uniref:collagen alpha-1(VI) chain-like n=1 Tax=Corticium candelabrum TaxID=121492 RepID=UPI002E26278D|nr:collagen alpha-1(VI) chain-like [Corticium candelabrum]